MATTQQIEADIVSVYGKVHAFFMLHPYWAMFGAIVLANIAGVVFHV